MTTVFNLIRTLYLIYDEFTEIQIEKDNKKVYRPTNYNDQF